MNSTYEIETNDLTKIYKRKNKHSLAVDHINLKVESGIHGFLGPNGAGKTSTINMLMGAISITEGDAFVKGEKAGSIKARKLIGFLPQDPILYGNMSATEFLTYSARFYGVKKNGLKDKIIDLIEFFNLKAELNKPLSSYSGGMKQKVGLASTLIHEPQLLILDEPTTNLDPIGRKNIINYIKKISNKMSIFVSSHILSEIEQMCEKVTIINKGKIILSDSISNVKKYYSQTNNHFILDTSSNLLMLEELKKSKEIIRVWLNEEDQMIHIIQKGRESLQQLISNLISKHNLIIKSFHEPETSLQDVFIELMKKEESI
jgi:ABC-2 type transport system ATP-binding protein